jgi:hypothetical protein
LLLLFSEQFTAAAAAAVAKNLTLKIREKMKLKSQL